MEPNLSALNSKILEKIVFLQTSVAHAGLRLPDVMQTIVDGIQSILNFEGSVIEVLEDEHLVYKAVSGQLTTGTLGTKVNVHSSLSGLAVKTQQVQRCNDTEIDPRVDLETCRKLSVRSMIVVPFVTSSEICGVLKVLSSRVGAFTSSDELIISVLADSLAASLHNAKEVERRAFESQSDQKNHLELHEQKEFLTALLENLSDGVVACDAKGTLTIFNKKLREWHGLPPTDISPEKWSQYYDLYHEDGITPMKTSEIPLIRAFHGEEVKDSVMVIAIKNKAPKTFLASGQAIFDSHKIKMGAVVVMHDVTEQRQSHAEISRLNQNLERIVEERTIDLQLKSDALDNSLNGFDIINSKGQFIFANKAYLKMWGYETLEEVLGTSPALHCADPDTPLKIITALKKYGECNIEFLAKRKDGSTFDVQMWARLAHDINGEEIYPTTSIDITNLKKHERELKEAIRYRDEFLSIASHELKTPLTSLKLMAQLRVRNLSRPDSEKFQVEKLRSQFQSDITQLDRLNRLVDDMLDITRINTGKLTLQKERFNLCQLTQTILTREQDVLEGKVNDIKIDYSKAVVGVWDKFRIEQVVSNLLSNAIKYGQGKPIHIHISQDEKMAILIIKDQGSGISVEDQERVFDRFERVDSKAEISGLGLGLYIVKQIVEMHQGHITVESQLGLGSSFIVRLPLEL
ncbi:MAG: PAS domain S-box protein [Bdellovibrionales bacterium]|nr:PAS domain S-box protein [Bdellovibrionales bacterium]